MRMRNVFDVFVLPVKPLEENKYRMIFDKRRLVAYFNWGDDADGMNMNRIWSFGFGYPAWEMLMGRIPYDRNDETINRNLNIFFKEPHENIKLV